MDKNNGNMASFTREVAKYYDSTLVPLIFEQYARDLAGRVVQENPRAVLEVACGTGVVTRALSVLVGDDCKIVATDINEDMLAHAESIGTQIDVAWRRADVADLPFPDESFDSVVCQFGIMFFEDRVRAYREIRRVLRPGARFHLNVWNRLEENELVHAVSEVVAKVFPENPPTFLAQVPFGHGDPRELEADLLAAGFADPIFEQKRYVSEAKGAETIATAFCQGTPLRNEIEEREPGGLSRITELAAEAIRGEFGFGMVSGQMSAVVVSARS